MSPRTLQSGTLLIPAAARIAKLPATPRSTVRSRPWALAKAWRMRGQRGLRKIMKRTPTARPTTRRETMEEDMADEGTELVRTGVDEEKKGGDDRR